MNRLVIDTSSTAASVALFRGEDVVGEFFINSKQTHSQKLMPIVDALLKQTDMPIKDIDAFYVCEGPGSFTGVRIGIATVKGFAQPQNKPVQSFSSMFLIASGVRHFEGVIVPIIDAKRSDVYYGVYEWVSGKLVTREEGIEGIKELLIYLEETYIGQSILLIGDAIDAYPDAFGGGLNLVIGKREEGVPKASNLAIGSVETSDASTVYSVKANYMRKSQAERDL